MLQSTPENVFVVWANIERVCLYTKDSTEALKGEVVKIRACSEEQAVDKEGLLLLSAT